MVEPRTSFAIQVKTNDDTIAAHNKVPYLRDLEIPFFLGIVDQASAALKIYSAEGFPMMSAVYGYPEKLWLKPVHQYDPQHLWRGESAKTGVTLDCPYLCTFTAAETRNDLRPNVERLLKRCRRTVANIGARRTEQHFYQADDDGKNVSVVAGCGSLDFFRDNMYKRLAEAFYNFQYMLNRDPARFDPAEFAIYEAFLQSLAASHESETLTVAQERCDAARKTLDQRIAATTSSTTQ